MKKQWLALVAVFMVCAVACSNSNLLVDNSTNKFCEAATGYNQASTVLDRLPQHPSKDELKAALDESLRELRNLESNALPAIKPDLQNVVDGFSTLLKIAKKYDYDFAKIPPTDPDFVKFVSENKIQKSGDAVSKYITDTCKVTGATNTTTPTEITSVGTSSVPSTSTSN